jgi:hypothetical protein
MRRPPERRHSWLGLACGVAAAISAWGLGSGARASEGGASFYLLGSGGPEAAIMPPLEGVYLTNTSYYYHGEAGGGREFELGGKVVAGLKATIAADFPIFLWVPSTNFLGGTVAFGGSVPFGQPWVNVSAVLTGPRGNAFGLDHGDTAFVAGDPILLGMIGWRQGNTHFQLSDTLNVPIGEYRAGDLANLAFNRWANDMSAAVTWHDDKSGWDLSAKSGYTLNGENPATDYRTGTEWHLEGSVQKALTPAWALGVQAYHFDQLTADSGAGATLGPFKGRVTGVGGNVTYSFKAMGKIPVSLRFHGTTEFDAVNRLQGHTFWLDLAMPLHVKMPTGAAPAT